MLLIQYKSGNDYLFRVLANCNKQAGLIIKSSVIDYRENMRAQFFTCVAAVDGTMLLTWHSGEPAFVVSKQTRTCACVLASQRSTCRNSHRNAATVQ